MPTKPETAAADTSGNEMPNRRRTGRSSSNGSTDGPAVQGKVGHSTRAAQWQRVIVQRKVIAGSPPYAQTQPASQRPGSEQSQSAWNDLFDLHTGVVRAVQRKEAPVDRSATREPASIDAPRADSIDEERATLPIQTRSAAPREVSDADTHAIAAAGVSGSGSPMPFAETLADRFGPDHAGTIAGISAHVGGPAADASHAIGASAYATGNSVAFESPPDLHTAAHEGAHIVQQQQGVHLQDGVGASGDPYEQHADAVADAVVRGESAAPLLGAGANAVGSATVQRKASDRDPQSAAGAPGDGRESRVDAHAAVASQGTPAAAAGAATHPTSGMEPGASAVALPPDPPATSPSTPAPSPTPAPSSIPQVASIATPPQIAASVMSLPPQPTLGAHAQPAGVGGIIAALDDRARTASAMFARTRQQIGTATAQHVARARADAAATVIAIEADAQAFSAQLHQAAHVESARAMNAAGRAHHAIEASASAVQAQIGVASQTAITRVPDADSDERAAVREALAEEAVASRKEVTRGARWNTLKVRQHALALEASFTSGATDAFAKVSAAVAGIAAEARRAGDAVVAQIEHDAAASLAAIGQLEQQTLDGIARTRHDAIGSLTCRPGADRPAPAVVERMEGRLRAIDDFLGELGGGLGAASTDLDAKSSRSLTEMDAASALARAAVQSQLVPQVMTLTAHWRSQTDGFLASADRFISDITVADVQVSAALPAKFGDLARLIVEDKRRSFLSKAGSWAWDKAKGAAIGIAVFVGLVLVGVVLMIAEFGMLPFQMLLAFAAACAALTMLSVSFFTSQQKRSAQASAQTQDLPWYDQMLGQARATFVAVGDTTLATPAAESATGYDAMSGDKLSAGERGDRFADVVIGVATAKGIHSVVTGMGPKLPGGRAPIDVGEETETADGATSSTSNPEGASSAPRATSHPGETTTEPAPTTAPRAQGATAPDIAGRESADTYTTSPPPKSGPARWKFLADPNNWTPARRALHERLIAEAKAEAQKFADAKQRDGDPPTIYAMRGNTAAGKSRTARGAIPELQNAVKTTSDQRSVNPDNFKVKLMTAGGDSFTSAQVHSESSMLATRLEAELRDLKTSDGKQVGSIMIDKRLATVADVQAYAAMAKETGRRLALYDVDAPLEVSLAGVLERVPGGADPLPPYQVIEDGYTAVRKNRKAVLELFISDPSLGSYELYATRPNGEKVMVAEVHDGKLTISDNALLAEVAAPPSEAEQLAASKVITDGLIEALTQNLDPQRAMIVRQTLRRYLGMTWKQALDAHSVAKAPTGAE